MDETDTSVREQLSRTDLNLATIDKIPSGRCKLIAGETENRAQAEKLAAEGRNFDRDRSTRILVAGAAIATASGAFGGLLTKRLTG